MAFVQLSNVSVTFGDRDILKNVCVHLSSATHAALAGINGSGKSTFMKIIAGILIPDSGERSVQKACRIVYLPQSGIVHKGRTVYEESEQAFAYIFTLIDQMEELGRTLEKAQQSDSQTVGLLERYQTKHEAIEHSGFYHREQHIYTVLAGLGFTESAMNRPVEEFSGGWQMRIALAKVLLEQPDILLLDEPTNYLDVEARVWLESYLENFDGGYLLISHDRYFLDRTVDEVYELFQGSLKRYAGNYSSYEDKRQQELEILLKKYTEQQEEIVKSEELIQRFRYKASKASMVQERIKKLEKMERIEIPESFKKITIRFPEPPHTGRMVLRTTALKKHYGIYQALSALDIEVEAGEKLLVVGKNGAGKSTLLRILAGVDVDYEGTVQYGTGVTFGYFSQESAELLTAHQSIIEFLESETPTSLIPRIRDMLGAFLFRGDDVYKPVCVLSGGEKSRLALLKMLLKPINLLILDEPTNHLDLHTKDVLLDTLKAYNGTVIFVSHDRWLMESLSTKTLELINGQSTVFYGNYAYYIEKVAGASLPSVQFAVEKNKMDKKNREVLKQRQTVVRRFERQEAELLAWIEHLEQQKKRHETLLAQPECYSDEHKAQKIQKNIEELTTQIEQNIQKWELKMVEKEQVLSAAEH
ncbi:MAG: ABC-F family ATP-binding cassette domain-containing protein [Treponema sp.]|jgi:ATP-binding cassette subfamily F protein 3|nr:ABC-F family ATP-binding cassette domain-containing protein [Treponema sp.]